MSDTSPEAPVLGIDLGGTKILAAVVDGRNQILGKAKRPTPARGGADPLMSALFGAARDALDAAGLRPLDLLACGVGSPGPLDLERGVIIRSPNLDVKDFPLGPGLAERLGCPVRVGNDVTVGGYGEFRLGAGRGYRDVLAAFVGTGIGGCLVQGGELLRGATGNAGEIGHIVIKAGGPKCGCGARGCLEALASRTAIVRRIGKSVKNGETCSLADHFETPEPRRVKSKELSAAFEARDRVVVREVTRAARFLGIGLASLINVLDPEIVIVGGGVVEALGHPYIEIVRDAARPHILSHPESADRIVEGALGDDSGVLGAALLAREEFAGRECASMSRG